MSIMCTFRTYSRRTLNRIFINKLHPTRTLHNIHQYSTKTEESVEDPDKPIRFSSSPASKWKASTSRSGVQVPRLWYEPYVVLASLTVFMLYFTVLREENDIDNELSRTLYSRVEGLEEQQLHLLLQYNEKKGLDTSKILERLQELEKEKKQTT